MIDDLDYVSVPVEDLSDAVRFYRDVLGLRLQYEIPRRWAEFSVGSTRLALYPKEEDEGRGGDVAFRVNDLDKEVSRLEACKVVFSHGIEAFEVPDRKGRLARFRDPSGNRLELVEYVRG